MNIYTIGVVTFFISYLYYSSPLTLFILISMILSACLGYAIGRYKDIFEWLKGEVSHHRYSYLVDRLLDAIEKMSIEETSEILIDLIYFLRGTTRYRPVRYIGETFECPISKEDIKTGDHILILPCGHMGGYDRMKEWIDNHTTCPICRQQC